MSQMFEMVCLIQEITQDNPQIQQQGLKLDNQDWQIEVKTNTMWAIRNIIDQSHGHFNEVMFKFIDVLTRNLQSIQGFDLAYTDEVLQVFSQALKMTQKSHLYQIEDHFKALQDTMKTIIINIKNFPRVQVIDLVTYWSNSIL